MVRFLGFGAGLVFVIALLVAALLPREDVPADPIKAIHEHARSAHWQHDGPLGMGVFGTFDRAQLQRGFKVYKEVCASCHSMSLLRLRQSVGESDSAVVGLTGTYHNLLRMWADA